MRYLVLISFFCSLALTAAEAEADPPEYSDPPAAKVTHSRDCCIVCFDPFNCIHDKSSSVCCGCCNNIKGANSEIQYGCCNNESAPNTKIFGSCCNCASGTGSKISNSCCSRSSGEGSYINCGCCGWSLGQETEVCGCCNANFLENSSTDCGCCLITTNKAVPNKHYSDSKSHYEGCCCIHSSEGCSFCCLANRNERAEVAANLRTICRPKDYSFVPQPQNMDKQ